MIGNKVFSFFFVLITQEINVVDIFYNFCLGEAVLTNTVKFRY